MPGFSKLPLADGNFIAYLKHEGKEKALPGIIFLGGFRSDMTGAKAAALEKFAIEQERDFIRFDYYGHGSSSGDFEKGGTIGRWKDSALSVLDGLTKKPQILVGSSMGGWLMLLLALARPERVAGLVGIASAPDFTETLIWEKMDKAQQKEVMEEGVCHIPSDECGTYPITRELIEDGRKNLLLRGPHPGPLPGGEGATDNPLPPGEGGVRALNNIPHNIPIRLIHGMMDEDVPYQTSIRIAELVKNPDCRVILQKTGNHRMSEPADISLILQMVKEISGR